MKILFTGMTATQVGSTPKLFMTEYEPMAKMLRDMGHIVERKQVYINEDLGEYDRIIVALAPIEKLSANKKYAAFDTLARYPEKCFVMFDDWQYYQFQSSCFSCIKAGRFWNFVDKLRMVNKRDTETLKLDFDARERIFNVANSMSYTIKFPVLYPRFPWLGPEKIRLRADKIILLDIHNYAVQYITEAYKTKVSEQKKRQWVIGAMFDQDDYVKNQGFTWDTISYGYKKKYDFLPENELCRIYEDSWGLVSHKNKAIAGDCWWRARWAHAQACGNIIWSFPEELAGLPIDFQYELSDIEKASDSELKDIAYGQRYILETICEEPFTSCEKLEEAIIKL
jgi:hypothetical protein